MKTAYLIIFAVIAGLLIAVLTACGGSVVPADTSANSTENGESTPETEATPTSIIISGGEEKYTIIRGSYAGTLEVNAAALLNKSMIASTPGWTGSISEDFLSGYRKGDIVNTDVCEIIVGNTNRSEGNEIYTSLTANQYRICVSGKKLIIVGATEYATSVAVDYFIENYVEKGITEFAADLCIDGTAGDAAGNDEIRVMSWNLGCDVGVAADVLTVINKYNPDVLSFQECNAAEHTKVFASFLKDHTNYAYVKKCHTGTSTVIYTPIIYNKDKLTLVEADAEWLDGRYTGTNTKSLCWAVFTDVNGAKFLMVNFHGAVCSASYSGYENMTDSERSTIANNWRIDNVRQILEVCDKVYAKYGTLPTTVNGDCNFNKTSVPYANLIAAGFEDSEFTAAKIVKTGLKTSYSYGNKPGSGYPIDHIFGKNGILFLRFDIINDDEAFTGSDHYPIIVDMRIK